MEPWIIAIMILAMLLIGGFVGMIIYTLRIAKKVYEDQLVRTSPNKWGRVCAFPDNKEQVAMWDAGIAWMEQNRRRLTEVSIKSDGFQLYGEYFDFGSDRCIIILPGRCESLIYSYYFAPPYEKAGFNVLVIDTRCHGKSEGTYNTIGVKERRDVLNWAAYVHETFGNKEVYMHGICIGTASGLYALTDPACPDYLCGLVTEGCFTSFRETFKQHMIAIKKPLFPVLDEVMLLINKYTETNVYKDKPISAIKKLKPDCRVLFLYGEQDVFSLPKKSQLLFDTCSSKNKKLVWFQEGSHSHLRINNTAKYDQAIIDFFRR